MKDAEEDELEDDQANLFISVEGLLKWEMQWKM